MKHNAVRAADAPDLEKEIAATLRNDPALPDYVRERAGVGALSAEIVVRDYEIAAKEIEAMGAELLECVAQCGTMMQAALAAIDETKDTAARYRDDAKRIFTTIGDCSLLTAEVRKVCAELKGRIAGHSW